MCIRDRYQRRVRDFIPVCVLTAGSSCVFVVLFCISIPMYPTNRRAVVIELIEKLKQEFDGVLHESNTYKIQRDQYERKLQSQLNELANIHSTVLELEKIQKDQNQWRRQMDGVPPPTNSTTATTFTSQPNHMRAPPTDEGKVNAPFYGTKGEKKRTFEQTGGVDVRLAKRLRPNVTPLVHAPSYELQEDAKKADRRSFKPLSEDLTTKKDDWVAGGVSSGPQTLSVDLSHTMPHKSVVCCVRFSKDGKFLATGCNKTAQIFDAKTGVKLHTFVGDEAAEGDLYIRSVCFSPDGKYLATGAEDKTVRVWDTTTKTIHKIFVGHSLDIYALDFSNDGKFIVSGSGDKRAKIWSMEDSTEGDGCLHTLGDDETGPTDGVTSVAISPDGKLVAAGSLDRIVRLWDAKTGRFLERYEGHLDSVYSVAFSPDGKFSSLWQSR
eukprot:TRINITY_DN1208_c0_g2_i1.p1 TRINITY_DN1208_c0_g2~~TRINITY_DN1208_c0_g2_i1.p1  ORF type:complete len:437 (+),score=69.91 TRINITY_DN1208_c0_g2_i1:44-1354(+)